MSEESISPASFLARLSSRSRKASDLILLTGERGCGKTRWCLKLIYQARLEGFEPVGLVSPAVFKAGVKTGIDLVDVSSGECRRLAVKCTEADSKSKTGADTLGWYFNRETLIWGNQVLLRLQASELLIIDELGPLEFRYAEGLTAGLHSIDTRDYRLACVVVRPLLLAVALKRWPEANVIRMKGETVQGGRQ